MAQMGNKGFRPQRSGQPPSVWTDEPAGTVDELAASVESDAEHPGLRGSDALLPE
jgi:hypothetical protein